MENYWWCAILFRIILPLVIAVAVFIRPTITSYAYLSLGCYMPYFSVPTPKTMAKATGIYLRILIITCMLTFALVVSFYFALYFHGEHDYDLKPCSALEIVIRTLGVVKMDHLSYKDLVPWCLPEPLMFGTSLILFLVFKRLCQDTEVIRATREIEGEITKEANRKKMLSMLMNFGKYIVVFMLCLTAVLTPSLLGGIYYFVFLGVMTYWACNKSLGRSFAKILVLLTPIMFLDITAVFWYQFQFFQDSEAFDTKGFWARLFNLVDLKTYKDCTDPRIFKFHAQSNVTYAMPLCLFFMYNLTVMVAREILQVKDGVYSLIIAIFRWKTDQVSTKWRRAFIKVQQKLDENRAGVIGSVMADKIKAIIEPAFQFLISVSYLSANFIMMVWAVAYVGWKTLVLLIWANLIWLIPFRKKVMLAASPFLIAWVWFLLTTSYLYSMDLTPQELPRRIGIVNFQSGIDTISQFKWVNLLTKSLFGVIIFVAIRQLWHEKALKKQQNELAEVMGSDLADEKPKSKLSVQFQSAFFNFFATWWIWVVIITMIWMDFWTTSNIFRIAFVGLAILFVMTFQLCPFNYWKKFLRIYWWIVIIYAMINLFAVYMYQIKMTRNVLHKFFGEEQFRRYDFQVWTNRKQLSLALLNPLFFQIAIVVQQNYLQDEFDKLTSPTPPEELDKQEKNLAECGPTLRKVKTILMNTKNNFCKILEVHMDNIILLVGWYMCIFDMCAIFFPVVLLLTAACLFGRIFAKIITYFISCLVQILILLRLIYMNQYMHHDKWNYVGHYTRNGKPFNKTLNSADWLGFHKSRHGREYADFWQLSLCFLYVFVVTVSRVVFIRMKNYRLPRNLPILRHKILFPEVTFENCHENTNTMLKFLANHGFYKFGCEVTAVFATIVMALRMDLVAVILAFWLLIIFALNRTWKTVLWLPSLLLTAIAIPAQYVATLGFWPSYWENSMTRFWSSNDFLLRIQQFCLLPNMAHPPSKERISLDLLSLLLLSRQWRAFMIERKLKGQFCPAGDNADVSQLIDDQEVDNPVPDFVTYTRSYLDIFKRIFFTSWFYLSLTSVFLAGTMRPTLYSFGYILGGFIFAWEGTDLFLRPASNILWRWNLLIGYTILIMITRTVSQIFGCILKYESDIHFDCAIYQMFTVGCVDNLPLTADVPNLSKVTSCNVGYDALGLGFDCLCFFFLIFQQRIFMSYHFIHIVNDKKAQTILADRGAILIEETKHKKREALDAENALIRNNINKKMDKIRATHIKVQGDVYLRRKKNHRHMLKSSDYYLFDDAGLANDIPLLPEKQEKDESEFDPYDPMSLTEYFSILHSSNIDAVLAERKLRQLKKKAIQNGKKPEDVKMKIPVRNARPGTSKQTDPPIEIKKRLNEIIFIWGVFESCIVSITGLINRKTKSFRNILNTMNRDRKVLKEKTKYAEGVHLGSNKIWHPLQSYTDVLNEAQDKNMESDVIQYYIYIKLLRAIWYLLLSHSEWLCYFVIIINQVIKANFISLPLVIITFCWGALSVPKPTKSFWIITFAILLIMLFIKNFFIMNIAPWNTDANINRSNLFFPPSVIGLTNHGSVKFNLFMLAVFFFHRVVLQMLGLWKPFNYRTASLIQDGNYNYKDGKLVYLSKDEATKNRQGLLVTSVNVSMGDYFPKSVIHGFGKYAESFQLFIQQVIFPSTTQIPVDVYTSMFLCDLINISLIMFWYGSFGTKDQYQGIIGYIRDNRVPVSFIVVVVVYVLLMIVDRGLYLRKNRFGKLVYYFFQVIALHIWIAVIYPLLTQRHFNESPVVQTFYVFKCMYFLLSAYQIKNGYPAVVSYHFLWHGTTIFNRFGYKFYRIIPYFFEMRTLLDWICSDSCLGVTDWFKMEEITQNIFDQKCEQDLSDKWVEGASKVKSRTKKYALGGFLYVLLILTVIFPFVLFSLGETVGVRTHPAKIKMELYMGSAEPIFQSYASERNLRKLTLDDYKNLTGTFNNIDELENIFGKFDPEDVVVVTWSPHSLTKWKVSPGTYSELMRDLWSNKRFTFRLEIQYTHIGHGGQKAHRIFSQSTSVPALPHEQRKTLIQMLESSETLDTVAWMPLAFPKFLLIDMMAEPRPLPIMETSSIAQLQSYNENIIEENDSDETQSDPRTLRNLLVSLRKNAEGEMWWQVHEECLVEDDNYYYYLKDLVHNTCEDLVIYTFNEKVFSQAMNYITQGGILGLYLLYFMMVIGIIRQCRIDIGEIWIEDLPDADDMMRKCLEVYVSRDMKNYELEEELFAELIFIMRSREVFIKLTRYKDSPYNPPLLVPGKKAK